LSIPRTVDSTTNRSAAGVLSFTNQSGTVYSLDELDQQLRNLQTTVERTLPLLTAFNTTYPTNSSGGTAGALGDLLGRVFHKNKEDSQESSKTSSQHFSATNVLGVLQGLMNTNKTSTTTALNPDTLAQLHTLQKSLEPVLPLLQSLNSGGNRPPPTPTGK
jgi:hypothetical protein